MNSSSEDEEDDPVIKEVDIYLAKSLMDKLYLFQYPVRPSSLTYDNIPHLAARMKPLQQKVELEIGMDINSQTYCFARGEQIAHAVDREDDRGKQKPFFPGHIMDRQVLSSVRATENNSKYAAALLSNDSLHITPVKGIIQLRPGFAYFDKAEENQKKAAAALIEAEKGESQSEDETADAKVVQLRFAKQTQSKAAKQAQLRSLASKKEAEESWIDMEFFQPFDRRAQMERNQMFCYHSDFESPEFNITSKEYMKLLLPRNKQDNWLPAALPHGVLSLMKLKALSLVDQIKTLMVTAKVIQFSQLCALLGGGLDENVVIKGLTQYAVLVQGCWVVKSEFLYPAGSKTQVSGLEVEKIWPSRDYMMLSFNRKRAISRKEIISITRLPTEELREVLEGLAVQRPAQGWEFILNTDMEFLQKNQETCSNQAALWKEKYKVLIKQLHLPDEFVEEDWKDTDFPGLFYDAHRKPSTPRRRRFSQSISEDNSDKNKPPRRRSRSRSQSSQDGGEEKETSKSELKSPKKKNFPKIDLKTPKSPTKRRVKLDLPNEDPSVVIKKTSIETNEKMQTDNIPNSNTKNKEQPDRDKKQENKNVNNNNKKESKKRMLKSKQISKKDMDNSIDSEDDELVDIPVKRVTKKQPNRTKKKKNIIIESENSEEEPMLVDNEPSEIIIADSEKLENEIVLEEEVETHDNVNGEDIFVPNMPSKEKIEDIEKPPSDIFLKELRRFCRDSIRSGCLSLSDLKEVLHMRQQEAGNILCTGVSDELLVKCVLDTDAIEVKTKWDPGCTVPESKRRLFLYRHLGESYDKFRSVVIDMFQNSLSLRRKDIYERFVATLGDQPTNHIYSKFMSEFCENHNGTWYLGCTYQSLQKYPTVVEDSQDDDSDS